MSLVLLFYPLRPYNGICQFSFWDSARLTFSLEAVTQGMWSHVWLRTGDGWKSASVLYHIGTSANERLDIIEIFLKWKDNLCGKNWRPPKYLKVMLRKDWHDGHHVAAYQFCGARLVMPSNDSRGGLCQQLLREMMESGKTAEWEIRRSTLRRHRDSNSVTRPDGWAKPTGRWTTAEKQKWGIIWVLGILA